MMKVEGSGSDKDAYETFPRFLARTEVRKDRIYERWMRVCKWMLLLLILSLCCYHFCYVVFVFTIGIFLLYF